MRRVLVLAAFLVTGCSSPQNQNTYYSAPAKAPQAEVQAANQKSLRCLAQYSAQLDDGVSDVTLIAKTVASMCNREREEFFYISSRGFGPMNQSSVMQMVLNKDVEAATYYILSGRASRK